jgi:EAL and modified HD-GYP domain-containing signal transduction protein
LLWVFKREKNPPPAPQLRTLADEPAKPSPPRKVIVRWRELIDGASSITGYILCPVALGAETRISGSTLLEALADEGIAQLIERRKAIVPMTTGQWREADFRPWAKPNTFFLLAAKEAAGASIADFRETATAIHAAGGKVAVDAELFALNHDQAPFADMLLLGLEDASLAEVEKEIRRAGKQDPKLILAVEGVTSWEEYRFLQSLGVALCVGTFIATFNDEKRVEKISQSRLVVVEMLNMLRKDADGGEIAALAKRDPVVVLKLIEMANSPLSALSRRVSTLEEAIAVLGHDTLYRWLALAMFRIDKGGNRDETIMLIALGRAAFLESLCPESNPKMGGELFLVGLFSLIDTLLQMPIEKIIGSMYLSEDVRSVLLRREGRYAPYLFLAVEMEHGRLDSALSLCATIGIVPDRMLECYSESRVWAAADSSGSVLQ